MPYDKRDQHKNDSMIAKECRDFNIVLAEIKKYITNENYINEIIEAYEFAELKHKDQKRHNGDPYIVHVITTAYFLAQWRMGPKTIIAGLLHDIIEDTPVKFNEIEDLFGLEVANLVESVTKASFFAKENRKLIKATYLRKLYLSMVRDIRVIIIKIADRLHNMLTLQYLHPEKQKVIAQETLNIYSAIAHRIGMKTVKSYLEDLSFKYLQPEEYENIVQLVNQDLDERFDTIQDVVLTLRKQLSEKEGLSDVTIFGRTKTFYSIYRKMKMFGKSFSDISDILAVRIITDTVDNCYRILGYVHQMYTPIAGKFKDYIAVPKNNLYQSIHTTVSNKKGVIFEIQIRTQKMDTVAENGIAAHWRYKEGEVIDIAQKQKELDDKIDILNQILELEKLVIDEKQEPSVLDGNDYYINNYIEKSLHNDVFTTSIYVLTPKGKVITMPFGSTVLDFAYHIRPEMGNHTTGAKINGVFSSIKTILNSGQMVEVIVSPKQQPNETWLNFVKTESAKGQIRKYLQNRSGTSQYDKKYNFKLIYKAHKKINNYIVKKNLKWKINSDTVIAKNVEKLKYSNIDQLLLNVQSNVISVKDAVELVYLDPNLIKDKDLLTSILERRSKFNIQQQDLIISDLNDVYEITISKCCLPIPGDEIVALVSKKNDARIHRKICKNVITKKSKKQKLFSAAWSSNVSVNETYIASFDFEAFDRPSLMNDITTIFSSLHSSIMGINLIVNQTTLNTFATLSSTVNGINMLEQIISSVSVLPNIIYFKRHID